MLSASTDSFGISSAKITPGAAKPKRDHIIMYAMTKRPLRFDLKSVIVLRPTNVSRHPAHSDYGCLRTLSREQRLRAQVQLLPRCGNGLCTPRSSISARRGSATDQA